MIIGAGAAGLAAAEVLGQTGQHVVLLEGRRRVGGRIHTVAGHGGAVPIELGAEFVHGENVCTWEIIRAAKLGTRRVPDRHWRLTKGALVEDSGLWEQLNQVIGRINLAVPDQDLQSFLDQAWGLSPLAKRLAKEYAEGFHAAPADRMSVHALARAEAAAEREEGTSQFRLASGYSALLYWFEQRLAALETEIHLDTVVRTVRWDRGQVEVIAQTPSGPQRFSARQAVVTLPLGVLQAQGPETVVFEPGLGVKEKAIHGLGVGAVVKLTMQFHSRFWPVEDFGFIHAGEAMLPTWWSGGRGLALTAWAGGPRAQRLSREGRDALVGEALRTLSRFFQVDLQLVRESLAASFTHDWTNDPFARGAYSFAPVRMGEMPRRLAAPLSDTLFFAGEATASHGDLGTVHGALASGRRAAREVLAVGSRIGQRKEAVF